MTRVKRKAKAAKIKPVKMTGIYQIEGREFALLDVTDARYIHLLPTMQPVAVIPWADYRRLLKQARKSQ